MIYFLFALAFILATIYYVNKAISKFQCCPTRINHDYDAIIVGGSIAGPTIAKALSDQGRKVLLIERKLFTKSNRIVGELLQPGGISALKILGMDQCATSIGMPCKGYVVADTKGRQLELSFRNGVQGVSFHFGDFVHNLREFTYKNCQENVTMIEGTVKTILTEGHTCYERAYGVEYTVVEDYHEPEDPFHVDPPNSGNASYVTKTATAPLIIMCDGGMSMWRGRYQHFTPAAEYHSNFIGIILKGAKLPIERNGTIFSSKEAIILSYRLDPNEVRVLVIANYTRLPRLSKLCEWLLKEVAPSLPEGMREAFICAVTKQSNIQIVPVAACPPTFPSIKGYVGIGDHNDQRNPLTGGGMTCAFHDAICLANKLKDIPQMRTNNLMHAAIIQNRIQDAIWGYSRHRYHHSSCINILSWALYMVFSTELLREVCFDYFKRGGDCVTVPMDLLGGLNSSLLTLIYHYFSVMLHGVNLLLTGDGTFLSRTHKPLSRYQKLKNALTFFISFSRLYEATYLMIIFIIAVVQIGMREFYSPWRLIDPVSVVGKICKDIKTHAYKFLFGSKYSKPVGF
ncbi:unnamed protein product [Phytomonas sp. Hart1]|nr:unnamed protein product [Phytomonas sp. Hart1]|eukprot:CCW66759.1 unnamed protein product [Phytomonas sp. isolate Hart1]